MGLQCSMRFLTSIACCPLYRDEIVSSEEGGSKDNVVEDGELKMGPPGPPFGIVLNGSSLVRILSLSMFYHNFIVLQRYALKMEDVLLETASRCQAVICCRVTPLQKVCVCVECIKFHALL